MSEPTGYDALRRRNAIRESAKCIGVQRLGSRIHATIETALNTASRRSIVYSDANGLRPLCRTINDYSRDDLKNVLRSVIGRAWTDEDDAIRAATRHLGFRRTGSQIKKAFKSALRGALRQGQFERRETNIRGD